ncbi:MAG: YdeI/OmpD-associated family protein [Bacteroidales bacterium]|nr:YdeI/OmpD-associated family protein [Bacteroidales bacterium]
MLPLDSIHFESPVAFRTWLKKNHATCPGIKMILFKKQLQKGITYTEALDEALCYGWIDSILNKLDDERYTVKFTPRKNTANWSEVNRKKVERLISEGRMTEAGLKKIESYLKTGRVEWTATHASEKTAFSVPTFIFQELACQEPALRNFNKLAPSHKKQYVLWITQAKRPETIQKRLQEAISLLVNDKKLGMK